MRSIVLQAATLALLTNPSSVLVNGQSLEAKEAGSSSQQRIVEEQGDKSIGEIIFYPTAVDSTNDKQDGIEQLLEGDSDDDEIPTERPSRLEIATEFRKTLEE